MILEKYFAELTIKLQDVAKQWPSATETTRLALANELFALRQASDQVIDLWMKFEESLSNVIKTVKEEHLLENQMGQAAVESVQSDAHLFEMKHEELSADSHAAPDRKHPHEHLFRKGEGFYHLRLYQDARACFDQLMQQSPDWEMGRLYYAYSLLLSGAGEQGMKEFRLLSRTASSPKVTSICYNAIGCMLAEEKQWLEAAQAFKAAIAEAADYADAHFNLALCYLHDEEVEDAFSAIEAYMELEPDDWEAEAIWLRAASYLVKSDSQTIELVPPGRLKVPTRALDSKTLYEMASMHEARGQIHRAQLCYLYLCEQLPREGWVYQGLAWHTWLIAGTNRALPLMKKAISLSPDNPDFQFTYGWMLLFDGSVDKAMTVFRSILQTNRDHQLARSGLVIAYERMGEIDSARMLARQFLEEPVDPFLQSLGYYHLGRLAVLEGNWKLAEQYFQRMPQHEHHFREVELYRRLCAAKLGKSASQADMELFMSPTPKP